ncbi:MAG: hypothetical protein ACI8QS_002995 [Planctomycetota bacterium]|jgi:hypothetical protein
MISLAFRLLPYALCIFGAALLVSGVATQFESIQTEPLEVQVGEMSLTDLDGKWVSTSGVIFFSEVVIMTSENLDTGEVTSTGYCAPLITEKLAEKWMLAETPSYADARLFVRMTTQEFDQNFPDSLLETSYHAPFTASGIVSTAGDFTQLERSTASQGVTDLNFDKMMVLRNGDAPRQKSEAAGLAVGGLLMAGVGFAWGKRRWTGTQVVGSTQE